MISSGAALVVSCLHLLLAVSVEAAFSACILGQTLHLGVSSPSVAWISNLPRLKPQTLLSASGRSSRFGPFHRAIQTQVVASSQQTQTHTPRQTLCIRNGNLEVGARTIFQGLSHRACVEADGNGVFVGFRNLRNESRWIESLGDLQCSRLLACSRMKLWWMAPSWSSSRSVPVETQFVLAELLPLTPQRRDQDSEQLYGLILPLVSGAFRATLAPERGREGIAVVMESGCSATTSNAIDAALWVSVGNDPFQLLEAGFRSASARTGTFRTRGEKVLPAAVEVFGYCTWNAFYSGVTAQGIRRALASLRDCGVQPQWLVVDDGWQDTALPVSAAGEENQTARQDAGSQGAQAATAEGGGVETAGETAAFVSRRAAMMQALQAAAAGAGQGVERLYAEYVEHAPANAAPERVWKALVTGPLRSALMAHFAATGDFVRRLASPSASRRFLDAGGAASASLGVLVAELKQEFGLRSVFVWHALAGYWSGVMPWSAAAAGGVRVPPPSTRTPYISPGLAVVEPSMQWNPITLNGVALPAPVGAPPLYEAMHRYLEEAGIDGVKVDAQSMVGTLGSGQGGGPAVAREFIHAMEASVAAHFLPERGGGPGCINCMCHASECLFSYLSTSVVRASDDFFPDDPASHTLHIANVAYNSLFIGEIAQPDWDMFQSKHSAAFLHAAARAVGGSPVYVSDIPGQHNPDILKALVLPDGEILRCILPGRPTMDCLFSDVTADGQTALKVWNRNACNAVVGAFNLQGARWDLTTRKAILSADPPSLPVQIRPSDVPAAHRAGAGAEQWVLLGAVWTAAGQHKETRMEIVGIDGAWKATLAPKDSAVVRISPVHVMRLGNGATLQWAAIGLWRMLNAGGAVLSEEQSEHEDGSGSVSVSVKGAGEFMLYCTQRPTRVLVDGREPRWRWKPEQASLYLSFEAPKAANRLLGQVGGSSGSSLQLHSADPGGFGAPADWLTSAGGI